MPSRLVTVPVPAAWISDSPLDRHQQIARPRHPLNPFAKDSDPGKRGGGLGCWRPDLVHDGKHHRIADPERDVGVPSITQVLIVSADKLGEEALRLHRAAIDAAHEAGVSRVLYTSHMGARAGSPFLPADQHAGTEADLVASGLAYTSLRHGFYAESCLHMVGEALRSGALIVPEDGPVSWTARDDPALTTLLGRPARTILDMLIAAKL